jgi:hypothetical protein
VDHQRQLAQLFIEKTKLCLCISHALDTTQYSVFRNDFGNNIESMSMLIPKASDLFELRECHHELQEWFMNCPVEAQYSSSAVIQTEEHAALHAHHAFLQIIYLTVLIILYCPLGLQENSRHRARYAALEMATIVQNFHDIGMAQYLPLTGITVLLPCIITIWHDVRCSNLDSSTTSLHQSCQCDAMLRQLRDVQGNDTENMVKEYSETLTLFFGYA